MGGLAHYVMPVTALGFFLAAGVLRLVRSSVLDALDSDYVTLARVKGLSERRIIWTHVLRNSLSAAVSFGAVYFAIMVTGSHIPADYNGLKFYRPDGELLKGDEPAIRGAAERILQSAPAPGKSDLPPTDPAVARAYLDRYTKVFAPDALSGLRIGIFEHSAVGRDLLVTTLEALGAHATRFGRNEDFVAVDTEAVLEEHMAVMAAALTRGELDAVVSTDGDGDRPLVLDETGNQINGDVLGALTARVLGADTVVTPLTSTSAIEISGWFKKVIRTPIGSPFVVEAMEAVRDGTIAGFEANGGFLLGSGVNLSQGALPPLPTRDAVLPILAVLAQSAKERIPLSALAARLPARVMKADRLKSIADADGTAFVEAMERSRTLRAQLAESLLDPEAIDEQDGTRLALADGTIVHFRQSGNAPELRCYVETSSAAETDLVLGAMMDRLTRYFEKGDKR
jgi:phosphomannomutase